MIENLESYAKEYGISMPELHLLDIQRLGLATGFNDETAKLRVSFGVGEDTFHKPIINNRLSPYRLVGDDIRYEGRPIPVIIRKIQEDSAEPYYFRGDGILVINSTVFGSCNQGCVFCEVTSAPEKRRRYSLVMAESDLFDLVMGQRSLSSLEQLSQISIVTSCAGTEKRSLELVDRYQKEAARRGFAGNILFATNEIRTHEGIQRLAEYRGTVLAFTVECFTNRKAVMPGKKGSISLPEIKGVLQDAKETGIDSTYFYIFGIDDLDAMREGFEFFREAITVAPTGPNYQPQGKQSVRLEVRPLKYFLEARKIYKEVHKGIERFEARQNYRSLWPMDKTIAHSIV